MLEVPDSRKDHSDILFVRGIDDVGIANGTARLNDCPNTVFRRGSRQARQAFR